MSDILLDIYEQNNVTVCKYNPQQTETEHAADLTNIFLPNVLDT